MKSTGKLYEAFGELIYVVAMADGAIQASELQVIEEELAKHPWGEDIKWSFDYESKKKNTNIEDLFKKVMNYCEEHGPDEEYAFLLDLLERVAISHEGKTTEESIYIYGFTRDLTDKFRQDLDKV